jgi:hypothetical protein
VALDNEILTVRIGGKPGLPERLLRISRPAGGRVVTREWTSDSWNTAGEERERSAAELLAQIEAAFAAGHSVSEEMYGLRLWLTGQTS